MGRRPEWTFLQRSHIDGAQIHEKMLNISNHQRNTNENYNELSPHICQNTYYEKNKKQTKQITRTGTEPQKWKSQGGLAGTGRGRNEGKGTGNKKHNW